MAVTATAATAVFVTWSFIAVALVVLRRKSSSVASRQGYSDEDGDAVAVPTPDASPGYLVRVWLPASSSAVLLLAAFNFVTQGFDVRLGMITSGWVTVVLDALLLARDPSQQRRFTIGLWLASSSTALSIALLLATNAAFPNNVMYWAQFGSGLALTVLACSLARRPDVFYEGRIVDRQLSCSALERIAYAWIRPLLDQARKERTIEYDDLPALGHAARSQDLRARFPSNQLLRQPLWRVIVSHHYAAVYQQWLTAILESIASVMPPICMFMILSLMEARVSGQTQQDNSMIWFWVMCLAVSKTLHVGLASWLQWASFATFSIPVRAQLSALIFAKSMRMTHSQEPPKTAAGSATPNGSAENDDDNAYELDTFLPKEEGEQTEGEGENESDAAEQTEAAAATGIVNLLGVDVARVAEFCGYNQDLLRGVVKVAIAASLLVVLIGWKSTLAGFAVPVILQPVNNIATKYYTSKQLEVMAARDNKAHVITEALHGIRQIKFSATEAQWEQRILAARERELRAQWSVYVWAIFLTFAWIAMPALIGAAALSIYAWTSKQMIASVAFTALSVFSSLEWTISAVPTTITEMLDARVSANRIEEHLNAEERHETTLPGDDIVFRGASIAWPSNSSKGSVPFLHDLNIRFPPNELSIISGKTGAGKSLLLAAIIGDAEVIEGEIQVPRAPPMHMRNSEHATSTNWIIPSAIAFVGQVPWIENASVKETILYGLPYHHERYTQVIYACALVDDIKILPDGEDTEIGATGINLSGGQRWRLTFARALYSRAGILIMDDIFSAVDSHVGRHLLDKAILGPLGVNRTKVLVTHHVGLVQRYAACLVTLASSGTAQVHNQAAQRPNAVPSTAADTTVPSKSNDDSATAPAASKPRKFVEDETRSQGRVKWIIYQTYLKASGGLRWGLLTVALFSIAALSTVARSYWLAVWTQAYDPAENTGDASSPSQPNLAYYLSIYLLISVVSISLVAVKITLVLVGSLRAARHLFEVATLNVLRARIRWLDTQPIGRILNRFVGDFALVDSKLGGDMTWCANGVFSTFTIVAAALFVSLWMIVPVVGLFLVCVYIVYLFLDASRDIKRLESTSKSPIHELVSSALSGLPVIRSFNRVDTYLHRMYKNIDAYSQTSWYVLLASQWMRFRQGILGMVFTLCIATGVAYFPDIDASIAGFALSFALDFSAVAEKTIDRYTATELNMNSMERVSEYMELSTESASGAQAPSSWPSSGYIVVRDLEVAYAEHLGPVLRGISFSVQPRQRIGIVGRTGSGKSSLMLSLFRFLEARKGSIEVDGLDLSSLRLHDIRSRLTIIPQDPVLFSGTLRSNLDLFGEHSDGVLLEALERVTPVLSQSDSSAASAPGRETRHHASDMFRNLSFPITRGGANLSQGEKQLICLARAIVARPKILVLDEATSAVDMETDALIQRSIRHEFRNSTLIVVAHRLSTVADFDKILVLRDGQVVEYDTPKALAKQKSLFWQMCNQSGEKEALKELLQ